MTEQTDIRQSVSEAYARAVTQPSKKGCCSGPTQKGIAAKLAGYGSDELSELPVEAVVNSFGCGNPLAFSEIQPGDVVLDLGSGAGIDILLAGKKVGPTGHVIGVDMTDEMIAKACENIEAASLTNVEVRKGYIEELPVGSSSVDWVISNCVINLSPDKSKVFAEIARVLKPGGRMLVSDIVVDDLPDCIRQSSALYSSCIAGAISESEYLDGLGAAGLVDAEVRERLVYTAEQLAAIAQTELSPTGEATPCCSGETACGSADDTGSIAEIATALAGKIWSAKVFARKPAECCSTGCCG